MQRQINWLKVFVSIAVGFVMIMLGTFIYYKLFFHANICVTLEEVDGELQVVDEPLAGKCEQ